MRSAEFLASITWLMSFDLQLSLVENYRVRMGKVKLNGSIREKETYAIVLILQKFRSWVASSLVQIMVMTDNESLQHWYTEDLNKATSSVGRRCRWHEF